MLNSRKNNFSIFYGPFPLPPHSHRSYQTLQYLTLWTFPLSFDLTASYFLPLFSFASNTCLEHLPFNNINWYKFRIFGTSGQNPSLSQGSKCEEQDLTSLSFGSQKLLAFLLVQALHQGHFLIFGKFL